MTNTGPADEAEGDVVVFVDLTGMPGWGSPLRPGDPDSGTILDRHAAARNGGVRLVQGSTALCRFADAAGAVTFALDVLAESQASGGSATAGAEVATEDETGPASLAGRVAAALATVADPWRVLVTARVMRRVGQQGPLSFDPGPQTVVDAEPVLTYAVRRRAR